MARNRTLSTKFWNHVKLSRMAPCPRLLFVGLVSMADDPGNILAEPFYLWKEFFAGDGVTSIEDVRAARDLLVAQDVVELYEIGSTPYIHHPNFDKHQYMNRRYSPIYPLKPGQDYAPTNKLSPKTHTEAAGPPRQTRMKMGPGEGDLAAYELLTACYAAIRERVDVPISQRTWKQRNKAGALELLANGKTVAQCIAMLAVAHTHPEAAKYYGSLHRLDKLAEAWPKLADFAGKKGASARPGFEMLPPAEHAS
jgi:hypothetical protein